MRFKKLMNDLRSEFGGSEFKPHVTVVEAISLTESEARDMFTRLAKAYNANVERVATGTFFYQCVFLLLQLAHEDSGRLRPYSGIGAPSYVYFL
ncbi:cyclic phosphodiesterase-like [Olea europaea subsp. europaea]|uniref:Cyclic phosphodiesterase-like n=1 Tax=Olea europaea subsp. europaea TaxID=158383 RepID=A0A8S0QEL3_OLEEU|nr:cyclic phosphodiesterase-like [Olea europaea subsp. europaea]